jgi:predicted transcriptional regulator of viral defense system
MEQLYIEQEGERSHGYSTALKCQPDVAKLADSTNSPQSCGGTEEINLKDTKEKRAQEVLQLIGL